RDRSGQDRRPGRRGDKEGSLAAGPELAVPRGPLPPPERGENPSAGAPGAERGHPAPRRPLRQEVLQGPRLHDRLRGAGSPAGLLLARQRPGTGTRDREGDRAGGKRPLAEEGAPPAPAQYGGDGRAADGEARDAEGDGGRGGSAPHPQRARL